MIPVRALPWNQRNWASANTFAAEPPKIDGFWLPGVCSEHWFETFEAQKNASMPVVSDHLRFKAFISVFFLTLRDNKQIQYQKNPNKAFLTLRFGTSQSTGSWSSFAKMRSWPWACAARDGIYVQVFGSWSTFEFLAAKLLEKAWSHLNASNSNSQCLGQCFCLFCIARGCYIRSQGVAAGASDLWAVVLGGNWSVEAWSPEADGIGPSLSGRDDIKAQTGRSRGFSAKTGALRT